MKSVVVSVLAVMVLAGTALAAIPSTTDYLLATQPMISGQVASVNDHTLVVDTDQGHQVTLAMDSRTMVPTDLAPGMVMRVEFKVEKDGSYYAKRIIPIRDGMSRGRELAYANIHGGDAMAEKSMAGEKSVEADKPVAAEKSAEGEKSTEGEKSMEAGSQESLPQTASNQPLILLLAALALGAAAALALSRRLRRA